jgi:hypothetical protein
MLTVALPLFVLTTVLAAWLEHLLQEHAGERALRLWSEHFFIPFTRALCLMLFIAVAYPALFSTHGVPALSTLMRDGERVPHWINGLFVCGLVAPALPVVSRIPGVTLPLQGCFGVALLFHWLCLELGSTASLLPQLEMLLALVALALIAALGARSLTRALNAEPLESLLRMWLQLPVLITYGAHLGHRLQP